MVDIPEFVALAELVIVAEAEKEEPVESVALSALDMPESVAVGVAEAASEVAVTGAPTETI